MDKIAKLYEELKDITINYNFTFTSENSFNAKFLSIGLFDALDDKGLINEKEFLEAAKNK